MGTVLHFFSSSPRDKSSQCNFVLRGPGQSRLVHEKARQGHCGTPPPLKAGACFFFCSMLLFFAGFYSYGPRFCYVCSLVSMLLLQLLLRLENIMIALCHRLRWCGLKAQTKGCT